MRRALVVGYLGFVAFGFVSVWQPRVFWTMLLPLVPVAIVLMGFANWRQICPLAAFGDVGRWLNRGEQRRAPAWMERWFFVVTFAFLLIMLVMRLVLTNGDGPWLSLLLVFLALAAALTNWILTGKSWCNFVCPVGVVERIYTEPNSLRPEQGNSQCVRCTACKKFCPDIDQENGYWRDVMSSARRIATYSFPGLVLAFYTYYWLRRGDWEAYFDGRWTRYAADADLVLGPGFFFAPGVPAVAAALLTLVAFSVVSYGLFVAAEAAAAPFVEDAERRRHLMLALAAFVAFNIFYLFAGAPTLRRLPGGVRVVAFVAPLVATLFLVKRWSRRREYYIRDKSAAKLLRNWPFDEAPPSDPAEVYARIKAGEHAREEHLAAYAATVREMIADGLVHGGEMRLLEEVRNQLGITARDHERVLAQLSEEERELFEREPGRIEQRAQLEGYETALTDALLRHAPQHELEDLRQAFGVSREDHERIVASMRSESGPLLERARGQLERAKELHADVVALGTEAAGPRSFLAYLLRSLQDAAVERVIEFLEIAGDKARIRYLRECLFAPGERTRKAALLRVRRAAPDHAALVSELEPLILERRTAGAVEVEAIESILERHALSGDSYVRAAALWAGAKVCGAKAGPWIARSLADPSDIVRETAVRAARSLVEAAEAAVANGNGRLGAADLASLLGSLDDGADESFESLATIERMRYLRAVPIFSDLDPEDLHDLSLLAVEETIEPPGVVCREGEVGNDLFVLVEGEVRVSVRAGSGTGDEGPAAGGPSAEVELGTMGPGEVIGELSLLDGSPRSATVSPQDGPIRVLRIPGVGFRSRLLQRPRVTRPLLASMARHIRRLSARAAGGG